MYPVTFTGSVVSKCLSFSLCLGLVAGASAQVTPWGDAPIATGVRWQVVASGLSHPWGITFLPNGNFLVTQRAGQLLVVAPSGVRQTVSGVPKVYAELHGGLLDVTLHPNFILNRTIYMTMVVGTPERNRLELFRGVLNGTTLTNVQSLFGVSQWKEGPEGFGGRMCWLPDKSLLVSVGDGGNGTRLFNGRLIREFAQDLRSHFGKILRLDQNGQALPDNPFVNIPYAKKEIWSYGHRQPQGLAFDPIRKQVFATEHGPQGGDELNWIVRGQNYGWPKATYGIEYSGGSISPYTSLAGMRDPAAVWTPCIGSSGLCIYTGPHFPQWRGLVMAGGMRGLSVRMVKVDSAYKGVSQTKIDVGHRIRQIQQGPDGYMYAITDESPGYLFKILPTAP